MGIKPMFTASDVRKQMERYAAKVDQRIVFYLQYLGTQCVNIARSIPAESGFNDQTGNLRSSMGYVIYNNGRLVGKDFKQTLSGREGVATGKKLGEQIASEYKDKIVLVVVAGMNYAVKVESRGKDVLTSAELYADKELPALIAKIKKFKA